MMRLKSLFVLVLVSFGLVLGASPAQAAGKKSVCAGKRGTYIDVNMSTHYLTMCKGGKQFLRTWISGGGEYRYCDRGRCSRAHTPRGTFQIQRKIKGVRHAPLGTLYSPMYFKGGYALHGSRSVPRRHASHGCIRLNMRILNTIYANTPIGATVRIHD